MENKSEKLTFNEFRELLKDTLMDIHHGTPVSENRIATINSHATQYLNIGREARTSNMSDLPMLGYKWY